MLKPLIFHVADVLPCFVGSFDQKIQDMVLHPPLQWRHNGRDGVSNHQPHYCLLKRLFRRRSKKTSKFRVTGHCVGNSPGTGEFPAQMASNAENLPTRWRHHALWAHSRIYTMRPSKFLDGVVFAWRQSKTACLHVNKVFHRWRIFLASQNSLFAECCLSAVLIMKYDESPDRLWNQAPRRDVIISVWKLDNDNMSRSDYPIWRS